MLSSAAFWTLALLAHRTRLNDRDFEWFEAKYPGWYAEYGALWEAFRATRHDPQQFKHLLNMALEGAAPSCWMCLMGCVFPEDMCHREVGGRTRFYCSKECKWLDESNPGRYVGRPQLLRPLPRLGAVGDRARPRLRARRREDAARPASPRGRRACGRSTTSRQHGLPGPEPEHHASPRSSACRTGRPSGSTRPTATSTAGCGPRRHGGTASSNRPSHEPARPLRADRRGDRLRRGGVGPRRRVPARLQPRLRLPRGTVLGLQGVPARGRGGAEALLDLRAVGVRGVERLHAAVPGDAGRGPRRRAAPLRPRRTTGSRTRSATGPARSPRSRR